MNPQVRAAVVGHIEWVEFLRVDRPVSSGAILHAPARDDGRWVEAAGGGGVAAAELARLAGRSELFTALGNDDVGALASEQLSRLGVTVHGQWRDEPHRRAVTLLEPDGERTITVIGSAQSPDGAAFADRAFEGIDAVYFCKGDVEALRRARQARVLVVTARVLDVVRRANVDVDALVYSGSDPSERYEPGDLARAPRLVARTEGAQGGHWEARDGTCGRWAAAPLPGSVIDTYGAGDSFAAGLTFALAQGLGARQALNLAARRGAAAVCRRGAHGRST